MGFISRPPDPNSRRRISMPMRRPISPAGPEVGIFWFIQEPGKAPAILGSGVAVGNGEPYGEYINYPGDHSQYWLETKPRLPPFFHDCGAKDWPRGRVIYNTKTQRFDVYLNGNCRHPSLKPRSSPTSTCPPPRLLSPPTRTTPERVSNLACRIRRTGPRSG